MLLQLYPLGATIPWDEGPPGSAGVPPAQSLPQPRPSPPRGSIGNGALTHNNKRHHSSPSAGPMRFPSTGWRLQHRAEAQMKPPGSAGVPPAQSPAQPRLSSPRKSIGNSAIALLRLARCHCCRRSRLPLLPIATSPGLLRAFPAAYPRTRLHAALLEACRMRFVGRPKSTAATPLFPNPHFSPAPWKGAFFLNGRFGTRLNPYAAPTTPCYAPAKCWRG